MSEETTLRITLKNKARFDQVKREESATRQTNLTQDQAFALLLDLYEQVNVAKTVKVTPA